MDTISDLTSGMKHTPGPWYVGTQNDKLYIITRPPRPSNDDIVDIPDVKVICPLNPCNSDANARLISAAPELLAVCQAIIAASSDGRDVVTLLVDLRGIALAALAAVSKAEAH